MRCSESVLGDIGSETLACICGSCTVATVAASLDVEVLTTRTADASDGGVLPI